MQCKLRIVPEPLYWETPGINYNFVRLVGLVKVSQMLMVSEKGPHTHTHRE